MQKKTKKYRGGGWHSDTMMIFMKWPTQNLLKQWKEEL
jgi:hypothetical protein